MIFAALKEAAERGELILACDGMLRWHRRRDGVVVIREVLVLPFRRRTGVGRRMVREVCERNRGAVLMAKCPVGCEANDTFWPGLGFVEVGRTEKLIEWRLDPSSCASAPTATSTTPALPLPPAGDTASDCPPEGC